MDNFHGFGSLLYVHRHIFEIVILKYNMNPRVVKRFVTTGNKSPVKKEGKKYTLTGK